MAKQPYKSPAHPTWVSQKDDWVLDLEVDIRCAERQAEQGPFYPERGITRESLLAYAEKCRLELQDPDASLRKALKRSNIPLPPMGI